MTATITFFPVDNGDMTLIKLADEKGTSLLIDCNIRTAADDSKDFTPDVGKYLRDRINNDDNNRPYVDAMLLTHPDKDHCLGLRTHFWLGPIDDYPDDFKPQNEKRIIIREMWSSPMVFRRASKNHVLCDDAKAFNSEAKRRVEINKKSNFNVRDGDRLLILGEDENGKTDELQPILIRNGQVFNGVNKTATAYLNSTLIAPFTKQDDESEAILSKNNSSVIISFKIKGNMHGNAISTFLCGGDADVTIWERVAANYSSEDLAYDLLLAPHHCSWRSLSHDSWSDNGEEATVSPKARKALSNANYGAFIVSSSKPILDDKIDPPCIRAKREYREILGVSGIFKCTGEEPNKFNPKPLDFEVTTSGFKITVASSAAASVLSCSPPRAGACK
ncbi:ComEC/Rec2 family competence protein [Kangiella sp. M94]